MADVLCPVMCHGTHTQRRRGTEADVARGFHEGEKTDRKSVCPLFLVDRVRREREESEKRARREPVRVNASEHEVGPVHMRFISR
jgi:hypothetical protein